MKYPEGLVHEYGAKAGILMYVAQELPDIPQAPMVARGGGETALSLLQRAEDAGIGYPRLYRSSAVAELDGWEGVFPTFEEKYPGGRHSENVINRIRYSPRELKSIGRGLELPDEIGVIIAAKTQCKYVGTYIKHPNQDNFYIISLTDVFSLNLGTPRRYTYSYRPSVGIKAMAEFSTFEKEGPSHESLYQQLEKALGWHNQVSSLAEMDPKWAYQVEFGVKPLCLFQFRPLKPYSRANFTVEPHEIIQEFNPLVIGITPKRGIRVRVEAELRDALANREPINPDNQPAVYCDDMRDVRFASALRNHQASILYNSFGLLAHEDIAAARKAQITAYYPAYPRGGSLMHGDWITIISDGANLKILRN